jgi:hypothetical protein
MKKNIYEKYNFNSNKNTFHENSKQQHEPIKQTLFETIKHYTLLCFNKVLYYWKHNRMMFLLILSLLFLLGYYIYVNYLSNENNDKKLQNKDGEEFLNETVKTPSGQLSKKRKTIPKKHETRCRLIMENTFRAPFISIRPDFLKYPKTGKNLELDVFNQDLMLALEYDGVHHRKYTEFFHKSEQDFIEQQERDRYKDEKCKELGITLIRVPDTVKYDDLEEYIKKELDKKSVFYV